MKNINSFRLIVIVAFIMIFICSCSNDDEPEQYIYPMTIVDADCKEFHIDNKAQQIDVGIRTNQDKWHIEFFDGYNKSEQGYSLAANWLDLVTTRADVIPKTLVFQVEENKGEDRKAVILIWSGEGKPNTPEGILSGAIEIYQAGVANP